MSVVPAWTGAQVKYGADSGQINQFLATHNSFFQYSGRKLVSSQSTGSAVYLDTLNQWVSQSIATSATQTDIGGVSLQLSTVGGSPTLTLIPSLTVSLYADSGGFPTGAALVSATVSSEYVYSAPFWVSIPLSISGLTTSTPYHLVTSITGTTGHYYAWQESTQTYGASTSPDGINWTAQGFGLMYEVYSQDGSTGNVTQIAEDGGNLVTQFTYDSLGRIATVTQNVILQDGTTVTSSGTLSYTNGLLTGVS